MKTIYINYFLLAILSSTYSCNQSKVNTDIVKLNVTFADSMYPNSISGKLIFLFSNDTSQSLIYGIAPNNAQPVYTYDIQNWNPNDTLKISMFSKWWHKPFSKLDGIYSARLIFDFDTTCRSSFVTKGNSYSSKQIIPLSNNKIEEITFDIDKKFKGWVFNPTKNITELKFKSSVLSQFWNYNVFIEAAIILPNSYNINAPSNYPIIFVFPGFGSHHASVTYGNRQINRYGINTVGKEKIFIFCNAEFKNGYHHFANSSNNGPWADAFITEFIPFINSKFNCTSQHKSYFLMGQSSGAWTSAWLIVNNPELFSGAFIASPDPIDFREMAFNIYKNNANFYFPEEPNSKQLTKGKKDKQYILLEDIVDEYGQIKSWEATFSPKSKNNLPARLFNRESGEIYPEVAENWKKYDISRIIKSRPEYFQNSLKNKLHFFVSEDDPYGLAKSIHLFETICSENNIEANFNYYNELGHNIWIDTVRNKIHQIIDSNEP